MKNVGQTFKHLGRAPTQLLFDLTLDCWKTDGLIVGLKSLHTSVFCTLQCRFSGSR